MKYLLLPAAVFALIFLAAGCENNTPNTAAVVYTATSTATKPTSKDGEMILTTTAFTAGRIPPRYAQADIPGGQNVSIPVEWENAPESTASYALLMIDLDANDRVHWAVFDISSTSLAIGENATRGKIKELGATELTNASGVIGYDGPKPLVGAGPHRYQITLYALSEGTVTMPNQPTATEFETAIESLTLGNSSVTGFFENK